ncbi:MAG: glycosyltransferase [Gammaproteobacteria bacterium]|nr:glycosyltransferase [Gammaproteobacteria bacterium]
MNEETRPLVSVVTPFYNTETYLPECIESVMRQTYRNWEYVLVNNCSTDRSAEIAQHYAGMDPRLRLVNNEKFLTQVDNYNYALRQISPNSKYCKIVQADDLIFENCLEEMVRAAERAPNVALVGSYSLYDPLPAYSERPYVGHGGLLYTCRLVSGKEMLRRYLAERLSLFGSPTCVMFRTSDVLASSNFFSLRSPVEDTEACFDVLQKGDFAFVHQVLTFNRRQEGSFWWKISGWDADALNKFILAHRYGRKLFNNEEFEALIRNVRSEYYRCLGDAVLRVKPSEYWEYHRAGLATVGQKIQKPYFAWHVGRAVIEFLANPKRIAGRLLRAVASMKRLKRDQRKLNDAKVGA